MIQYLNTHLVPFLNAHGFEIMILSVLAYISFIYFITQHNKPRNSRRSK